MTKQLWSTPLSHYKWDDEENLGKIITDIIMNFPSGIDQDENPSIDEYPELKPAHDFAVSCSGEFLEENFSSNSKYNISWWVHVYREGFHHHIHNHLGSQFTGILYLQCPPVGGELVLHDPRGNANRAYNHELRKMFEPVTIQPETGDLFIFPSFVWHNVHPVTDLRICMPFDIWC